jgi:hypothetical protein
MTGKKWYGVLVGVILFIISFILLTGISQHGVTNLYLIPAGTFDVFPGTNGSMDQNSPGTSIAAGDHSQDRKIIDSHFEVQEWDIGYVHTMTIVPVTYDELKDFPDFEQSMHGVINGSGTWVYGHRVVAWFDGNESDLYRFYHIACKNETRNLADCYPNPPIFEYHGQYYMISSDSFGYHRLAGCERGNYNCTGR